MLLVPPLGFQSFRVDNRPATPSSRPGTSVPLPATAATWSSWVEILSAAQLTERLDGITLLPNSYSAAGALDRSLMLELGVDPAGGTAYTTIVPGIVAGCMGNTLAAIGGQRPFHFPIKIPAGASIAVRARCMVTTSPTLRVLAIGFGGQTDPSALPVANVAEAIGHNEAGCRGTIFTPGSAGAWGAYTSLGTTSQPLWWWQAGYTSADTSQAAVYTDIEVAFGDATNKTLLKQLSVVHSTSEYIEDVLAANINAHESFCPLPAGTQLFVRGRCSGTPDSTVTLSMIGFG